MDKSVEFDYETINPAMRSEYDSVTANGVEFARIIHDAGQRKYVVREMLTGANAEVARKGTHHGAFEAAMTYGLRKGVG